MTENHLPAAIADFIDATNRADSDAFVAAFTGDAYLNDWGTSSCAVGGSRACGSADRARRPPGQRAAGKVVALACLPVSLAAG